MKEITQKEFFAKVESGVIKEVFTVMKRVYGTDYSYDFTRAEAGKICEVVFADVKGDQ